MSIPENRSAVFVVIPSYNEQTVIRSVIEDLLPYGYNVVVVDDGSENTMNGLLHDLPVYLLRHPVNLGQGAAIQTGLEFALSKNAEYIITFDADGQHLAADIEKLLEPLASGKADIVLGSRFMKGAAHNMPAKRKTLLQIGRRLNYLFTGLLLTDAHNGLRAISRKAAMKIHITENRMAHATELLSIIKKNKLRYTEVPVTVTYTAYSRKKGQALGSSFRIVFDLLLNKIFR
ncbi:MAG TPA: glycosyltransferase family 2 protein [Chitinophagaceae bacterium]